MQSGGIINSVALVEGIVKTGRNDYGRSKNYPPYLDHAKPYKAKTNAESIRALSDEDLANFLIGFSWLTENGGKICYKTIARWLQQPAKEE